MRAIPGEQNAVGGSQTTRTPAYASSGREALLVKRINDQITDSHRVFEFEIALGAYVIVAASGRTLEGLLLMGMVHVCAVILSGR